MKFYKNYFNENYNIKDMTLKNFNICVGPLKAAGPCWGPTVPDEVFTCRYCTFFKSISFFSNYPINLFFGPGQ